jgi:hypothetical protein
VWLAQLHDAEAEPTEEQRKLQKVRYKFLLTCCLWCSVAYDYLLPCAHPLSSPSFCNCVWVLGVWVWWMWMWMRVCTLPF